MLGSFEPDINGRSDWKADPQLPSDANTGGPTNSLADVLSAMPNLCHVVVVDKEERGVPWPILKTILLAPPLRAFDLFGRLPVSTQGDMTFKSSFGPMHLTSFRYIPDDSRKLSESVPSEKRVLSVLLEKLSSTLQVLHLPCKSVPFRELKSWDWPHLQELYLRGDGRSLRNLGAPLVSTLSCMPRLRRLSLKLGRTEGHKRFGAIWPPKCPITVIPWPELEPSP
ncbi:hypothetical protein BN946_scf185031.g4 [Trametes cinnabarina]|uniref:Uncharacterized protein n=1 Tax=Pycnoporus cinnabarinus TaxID=5643 RepID=A0A060SPV2_PYCCI|nr:hypothetical protein BN946_scf185031.g4 [Trametes cinnabarina]